MMFLRGHQHKDHIVDKASQAWYLGKGTQWGRKS